MQGNRAPPQERATPRVRSLTRAAGIQGDEIPDCWYWGIKEVSGFLFSTLPILMTYVTRSKNMLTHIEEEQLNLMKQNKVPERKQDDSKMLSIISSFPVCK